MIHLSFLRSPAKDILFSASNIQSRNERFMYNFPSLVKTYFSIEYFELISSARLTEQLTCVIILLDLLVVKFLRIMKYFTLLLFSFMFFSALAHKHYVSITEIKWNGENQFFEVTLKLTAHDFEHLLEDSGLPHVHVENMEKYDAHYDKMLKILESDFQVFNDGKMCQMDFLGYEVNVEDELFIFMAFIPEEEITGAAEIEVKQSIFFSKFPEQQNIIHFENNDKITSETLVKEKPKALFYITD